MNQHTPIFDFDNFNILNCILNGSLGLTMKDNKPPVHTLRPAQIWQFVGNITSCN